MSLSQGRAASLRHSEITELSFLDQFSKRLGRFLDWNLRVDSGTLEQVQLLGSPEVLVDVVNTTPQAFLAANPLSYNPTVAEGGNSRRIWAREFEVYTSFDG